MEIVVRTPHGDADVSIVSTTTVTTIGDVVATVTGQAVPRLVQVDGHAVDASTPLGNAGLVVGSVVTSEPVTAPVTSDADVDLVQVAGHGAGRVSRLEPGRYRIGPGRRTSADELALAPVEHTLFEIVVEPTPAASEVSVVVEPSNPPGGSTPDGVRIDGVRVEGRTRWSQGTLTVGARAFQFDAPAAAEPTRTLPLPDRDGSVVFNRPPRRRAATPRRPVVDAVRDALGASPSLWERRPGQPDAFALPIGLRVETDGGPGGAVATADLNAERAVAIAGSDSFRSALARTLAIEAITLHGPADVDVVVLTDVDRLAHWDWAKWAPHLRLDGPPAIWSTARDIARWADGAGGRAVLATTPWISSHLTVVFIDDARLWNRRESPLRAILSNPPDDLRLVALCDDAAQAPAICTTVVSETATGLAWLQSFARSDDDGEIRPALAETTVAVRVARALAPLADVALPPAPRARDLSTDADRVDLSSLLDIAGPDEVESRWASGASRGAVTIGRRGTEPVELEVSDDVTVVFGSSIGDAFDVTAGWVLGQAVDRSPDDLWIVPIIHAGTDRSAWWWQLPHATDPYQLDATIDEDRLVARLRAVLADPDGPDRVIVVAEATSTSATPDVGWLRALAEGVRSTDGLALVIVTDRPELAELAAVSVTAHGATGLAGVADTVVTVDSRAAADGPTRRRSATVSTRDGAPGAPFTPLQRSAPASAALVLEPFVIGRPFTPLERRLDQQRSHAVSSPDPALDPMVGVLRDAASRRPASEVTRTVVPPPMPTRVDLDHLFETSPGDGVPLGLVDDPATAAAQVLWWQPGTGAMLVFGSRRSGTDQVLATIVLGLVDRFTDHDVRLLVVEPSSTRRRAIGGLGRRIGVVAPDQLDDVTATLDELDAALARRAAGDDAGPATVLLINDLAQLRRKYADHPLGDRIDDVLGRATAAGIDVVASAAELVGAGPFALDAPRWLVGASSNHDELRTLGVDRPSDLDGVAGRCRSFPGGQLVQLAVADAPAETLLARRSTGGTT